MVTYMPGSSVCCAFGTSARRFTAPVVAFTVTSEKSSVPDLVVRAAIGQGDLHGRLVLLAQRDVAAAGGFTQRQQIRSADGEVHIERIDLLDRGQQGAAGAGVAGAAAHHGA